MYWRLERTWGWTGKSKISIPFLQLAAALSSPEWLHPSFWPPALVHCTSHRVSAWILLQGVLWLPSGTLHSPGVIYIYIHIYVCMYRTYLISNIYSFQIKMNDMFLAKHDLTYIWKIKIHIMNNASVPLELRGVPAISQWYWAKRFSCRQFLASGMQMSEPSSLL